MPKLKERRLEDLQTLGVGVVAVPISFGLNGTSAPTTVRGLQCSVARADTGLFTVTMPGGGVQVVSVFVAKEAGTKGANLTASWDLESCSVNATAGTFGVRTMNSGTSTLIDVAASATARVNCVVWVATSDVRLRGA